MVESINILDGATCSIPAIFPTNIDVMFGYVRGVYEECPERSPTFLRAYSFTSSIIDDGQKQFKSILNNIELPNYGSCWNEALHAIDDGCGHLNEVTQSKLALMLTDCFMAMSGEDRTLCANVSPVSEMQMCIKKMPDRAFHVYLEFYTHAQNICFFLKSFIWQDLTERSIYKLSSLSHVVQNRLEEVQEAHDRLVLNQKESLDLQQDLVQHGSILFQLLQESRTSVNVLMNELQKSTQEQAMTLNHLSAKLSALQAWAIGEVSWLESLIFYIITFTLSYLMTSIPRAQNARLYLYIILIVGLFLEQLIHRLFLSNRADQYSPMFLKADLYFWIWKLRSIILTVCIIAYVYCISKYKNYAEANYKMLLSIHDKVSKLYDLKPEQEHSSELSTSVVDPGISASGYNTYNDFVNCDVGVSMLGPAPAVAASRRYVSLKNDTLTTSSTFKEDSGSLLTLTEITPNGDTDLQFSELKVTAPRSRGRPRKIAMSPNNYVSLENSSFQVVTRRYNFRSRSNTPFSPAN